MKKPTLKGNIVKFVECNDNCSHCEVLPSNARYCPVCGASSTFYTFNILKSWNYRNDAQTLLPDDIPFGPDEELPFN